MDRASALIVEPDAGSALLHAASLRRLGFASIIAADWRLEIERQEPAFIVLGPNALSSLSDLRRVARSVPVLVACDEANAEHAACALDVANVAFVETGLDIDYAVALALLRADRPLAVADGDAGYALRLAALGEEIARIARAIEPPEIAPETPVPDAPLTYDPALMRATLKARRLRDSLFSPGLFADPVWDMLLDLAASRAEGKRVSVTSIAIAASVPPSTALRHLKAMVDAGMVVRRPDPEDGRRIYIELSEDALARMRAWVAGVAKAV